MKRNLFITGFVIATLLLAALGASISLVRRFGLLRPDDGGVLAVRVP